MFVKYQVFTDRSDRQNALHAVKKTDGWICNSVIYYPNLIYARNQITSLWFYFWTGEINQTQERHACRDHRCFEQTLAK